MDGFTAIETLEKIEEIGSADMEKEILRTFPKKDWFSESPLKPPPYTQWGGAPKSKEGRSWGRRRYEPDMLNVRLPVARKFDTEGRVVDFPEPGSVHEVEGIGKFIVEDVILEEGRRTTGQVKVKWIE